jgi:hypothetical protein
MSTFWLETVGIGLIGHGVGLAIISDVRVATGHDLFGVFRALLGVVARLLDLDSVAGLKPVRKFDALLSSYSHLTLGSTHS